MRRDDKGWFTRLQLPSGIYEYKFIVDNKWITAPANKLLQADGYGHWNSV